jgi:RNA polymerase sigma-70 factor (ECF subfamily)
MAAFRELYEHTRPDLHNTMARLVEDEHDAHEIVQLAYVKAWQGLHELREDAAFAGWLRRIAMNLLRDHWRRTNRFDDVPPDDTLDALSDPEPDASDHLAQVQTLAGLDLAVQTLPEMFRLPVVLHYLDERSVEEVAGILDVPRGTVLSRLSRARTRLKEYLLRGNHAP